MQWPAAVTDTRLRVRAVNSRFVERWKALGGNPDVLSDESLATHFTLEDQLDIRHDLWQLPAGVPLTHTFRLTDLPAVLDLTPLESDGVPGGWLATLHDLDSVEEPSVKRLRIGALVHDLRTPVQVVLGWVSLMRKKRLSSLQLDHALGIIERNMHLQAEMLSELLAVTRLAGLQPARRSTSADIAELVRSTVDALGPLAENAGVEVRALAPSAPVMVPGDVRDLTRIVSNLMVNAIKYSERGGRIECRVAQQEGSVRLTVHDEGRGIAPGFLPHVFDSYCREQPTDSTVEGAGLGLAVVRHLVERSGGFVRAESAGPGCGATFTVTLPSEGRHVAGHWPGAAA